MSYSVCVSGQSDKKHLPLQRNEGSCEIWQLNTQVRPMHYQWQQFPYAQYLSRRSSVSDVLLSGGRPPKQLWKSTRTITVPDSSRIVLRCVQTCCKSGILR